MKVCEISVLLTRSPLLLTRKEWTLRYLAYKESIERAHSRKFIPEFYLKAGSLTLQALQSLLTKQGTVVPSALPRRSSSQPLKDQKTKILNGTNFMFTYPISFNHLQRPEIQQHSEIAKKHSKSDDSLSSYTRLPEETLYLVLKKGNKWSFPQKKIENDEFLHTAAQNLVDKHGKNLRHWVVGKVPVAHDKNVFFMRSRFISGDLEGEYAWMSKNEIQQHLKLNESLINAL